MTYNLHVHGFAASSPIPNKNNVYQSRLRTVLQIQLPQFTKIQVLQGSVTAASTESLWTLKIDLLKFMASQGYYQNQQPQYPPQSWASSTPGHPDHLWPNLRLPIDTVLAIRNSKPNMEEVIHNNRGMAVRLHSRMDIVSRVPECVFDDSKSWKQKKSRLTL